MFSRNTVLAPFFFLLLLLSPEEHRASPYWEQRRRRPTLFKPCTGDCLSEQLPVLTKQIWQLPQMER